MLSPGDCKVFWELEPRPPGWPQGRSCAKHNPLLSNTDPRLLYGPFFLLVDASAAAVLTMASDDVDPSDFVQRIQALSKKRDEEDAERFRHLEEQIQRDREERLARRAGEPTCAARPSASRA